MRRKQSCERSPETSRSKDVKVVYSFGAPTLCKNAKIGGLERTKPTEVSNRPPSAVHSSQENCTQHLPTTSQGLIVTRRAPKKQMLNRKQYLADRITKPRNSNQNLLRTRFQERLILCNTNQVYLLLSATAVASWATLRAAGLIAPSANSSAAALVSSATYRHKTEHLRESKENSEEMRSVPLHSSP